MLGAIIGDVVGSRFEFNNIKTKEFDLISSGSKLTDDSIMTLAVAEILQKKKANDRDYIIDTLKKWGKAFPNAGYGGHFYYWVLGDSRKSYNSFGNGAAMRVSACGWYGRDEEEVKEFSRAVTEVTHSHPEGIKGAEVTAMCVYYAKIGKSKEFIKQYVEQYYSLDFDYEELKRTYKHEEEICQNTVPQAIYCFLISNDFEDCLRTTISIGGDCDTTAAISCAIAEAYYKYISTGLIEKVLNRLPKTTNQCDANSVVSNFLEFKAYESVSTEEISSETAFLCTSESDNLGDTTLEWSYSKSFAALGNFVYYCLLEKNEANGLKVRQHSFNVNYYGRLKETLTEINSVKSSSGSVIRYILFRNLEEAMEFLNKNCSIKNEIYTDIFTKTYKVNKIKC